MANSRVGGAGGFSGNVPSAPAKKAPPQGTAGGNIATTSAPTVLRNQVIEPVADSMSDGNLTSGRHNYYGTLYLGTHPVGGMQAWNLRETNGTQFIPNAGNDWLEPRFGMRMWQGQGSRFQVRGKDLQELLQTYYVDNTSNRVADVDFRFLPFNWHFQFKMDNFAGGLIRENTDWYIATVWITEYGWKYSSPQDLLYEDFSFIAKGLRRVLNDKSQIGNPIYLWGTTQAAPRTNPNSSNTVISPTGSF